MPETTADTVTAPAWVSGEEPGGARQLTARWVITGTITLETAAHLGGGTGDTADLTVLRDAGGDHDPDGAALTPGAPLLTGASLAGALRSHLADMLGGYGTAEPPAVAHLFGGARADDRGTQSPLVVFDARATQAPATELRDGVRINPATGTAADHGKYDLELLAPGTRFPVRVELLVDADFPAGGESSAAEREQEQVAGLTTILDGLHCGDIRLGARRSRGLGRIRGDDWLARRHPLDTADGWLVWLTSDHERPFESLTGTGTNGDASGGATGTTTAGHAEADRPRIIPGRSPKAAAQDTPGQAPASRTPTDAVRGALHVVTADLIRAGWDETDLPALPEQDRRRSAVLTLDLRTEGAGLLVRSPGATQDAPDAAQLRSGDKPVLPGTSLAGVLRAHARRIARQVRGVHGDPRPDLPGDANAWVDALFGPYLSDRQHRSGAAAARLRVDETIIKGGRPLRMTRIRIDRFTQGVAKGFMFDEEPHRQGHLKQLRLELRRTGPAPDRAARRDEDAELGLLLLVVKDLLDGQLPLGGAAATGRGVARGKGQLHIRDGRGGDRTVTLLPPGSATDISDRELLDAAITAFLDPDVKPPPAPASTRRPPGTLETRTAPDSKEGAAT